MSIKVLRKGYVKHTCPLGDPKKHGIIVLCTECKRKWISRKHGPQYNYYSWKRRFMPSWWFW